MTVPDAETGAWLETAVGPFEILSHFSHGPGYSRLWRLRADGSPMWLKSHVQPHKWAGEVHALREWTPELDRVPRLLGWNEGTHALLVSEVEGENATPPGLAPQAEARLWREAGAWLARLHRRENEWFGDVTAEGAPHGTRFDDAPAHLGSNWEGWLSQGRASNLFDVAEWEFVEGSMREGLPRFAGEKARAIHRDYTPRNWLQHPDGRLAAVIDFEHARWDVRAADLERPWDADFRRNPELREAFYDGYGDLDDLLRAQIETMRIVKAFTTVIWATGMGDPAFAQHGRDSLHRLMGRTPEFGSLPTTRSSSPSRTIASPSRSAKNGT